MQENYDQGWHAKIGSAECDIGPDGLGMMVIRPKSTGHFVMDLIWNDDLEAGICMGVQAICPLGLLWTWRSRWWSGTAVGRIATS